MHADPAFLKATREAPVVDALRPVYADWLQSNGHSERLATLTDVHFDHNGLIDTTTAAQSWDDHLKLTALNLMSNYLSGAGTVSLQTPHHSLLSNHLCRTGAMNLAKAPFAARYANCRSRTATRTTRRLPFYSAPSGRG